MKTSEIFEACIPLIESGEVQFICHAITEVLHGDDWEVVWADNDQYGTHIKQEQIILDRLAGCDTFLAFVFDLRHVFGDILGKSPHFNEHNADFKDLRVEWLKSLVIEFRQLGD